MIIHAYGVLSSPLMVSNALKTLNISHTVINDDKRFVGTDHHLGTYQPAWPIVLPSAKAVGKYSCSYNTQIIFICDSLALLSTCNLRLLKPEDLSTNLQKALQYATDHPTDWHLQRQEPSINDYVSNATRPSFLNACQNLFYKISPYDLRKEVQQLVIGYLAGVEPKMKVIAKLNSNYKLDELRILLKDPMCGNLIAAVDAFKKSKNAEASAAAYGVEPFELRYIAASSGKTQDDLKAK